MADFGLGVWSHRITDFGAQDEMRERVARLAEAGFDLVIPCVKNPPGAVDFFTDAADVNPEYPPWDPLKVLIEACAREGMKVHPWFCVFAEGERSRLLREHPDYRARTEEKMQWACACREPVQDYVLALYRSLAEHYRPAGLHLDYIRTGGVCRCDFCASEMKARGIAIADAAPGPPEFETWTNWRVAKITGFVRRVHDLTSREGIELSAAVFAGYPECIASQGQDWAQWAEEQLVDFMFPMNYTQSARVAAMRTKAHLAQVAGAVPVWEGICKRAGQFSRLTPEELGRQMRAVLAEGARGAVIFSYGSLTAEDLAVVRRLKAE